MSVNRQQMNTQKLCLYNFEWQSFRTDLNFVSVEGVTRSIERCIMYLGNGEDINKTYRVLNLMCAVRMGLSGSRKIATHEDTKKSVEAKDVLAGSFLSAVSLLHIRLKSYNKHSADSEEKMVSDLHEADEKDFKRVFKSLTARWTGSGQNEKNRPELKYYLDLMNAILNDRRKDDPIPARTILNV